MQRNLVICMVPTVLAFFAIYWLKRRKKPKPVSDFPSEDIQQEERSSLEFALSSDLDNTLSDASSFTSPRSSEKSSKTDSPLFDSPLHIVDRHAQRDLVLPNCIEDSRISYASEGKDFLRIEEDFKTRKSTKCKTLKSPGSINQNVDFFESDNLFLCDDQKNDNQAAINQTVGLSGIFETGNNNPENCMQRKMIDHTKNLDNLADIMSAESEKIIETDCHSSAYDENSLSYVSDDSDGKQLVDNKNKGSLSSVLDESSLLSSFCDELEKSSSSNSPIAVMSNHFGDDSTDAAKDVLDLLSFKESSINIKNYTDSYHSKVADLEKLIKESSAHISWSPETNESSLTSNEKSNNDSITFNVEAALENEIEQLLPSAKTCNSGDSVCNSIENGYSKISSFSANKTTPSSVTYASILNSNRNNNSSSDAANSMSLEFTSSTNGTDSANELLNSVNWPLPNSKSVSESTSNQTFNFTDNEILPSKKYCEIKTNSDSTAADKISISSQQKDCLLESSSEEGYKSMKQCKVESNGFFDQKTSMSQSSKEFVYEFELPQELCGRLIGKHGRNVKSIMEHSNANVFIKHHPYDPLLKVVVVEGHRADVNEALEIIRRKYPPSMFPAVTLVQTNVLSSTGVPMPESLQLHLPEGASCDVILSSLVSAGHFFLQQPTHPTYPSLSTLDQCMINLYSQVDTPPLPQPIEAGVICAAPVYRGWYRAQVVYVCDNSSDCGIKFVDYGGFSQVPISSLRQIRSDFMSLPFQASECYLAHVQPLGGDTWSSEATSVFEELAQGQILQALLVEYADDGIPCVYLYRVQGVSSTFINKELVERGLAEWGPAGNNSRWDPH